MWPLALPRALQLVLQLESGQVLQLGLLQAWLLVLLPELLLAWLLVFWPA